MHTGRPIKCRVNSNLWTIFVGWGELGWNQARLSRNQPLYTLRTPDIDRNWPWGLFSIVSNPFRPQKCNQTGWNGQTLKYRLEIKNPVRAWDNVPLRIVFFHGKQVPIRFRSVYTNEKGKVRASQTLVGRRIESFLIILLAELWNRKFESEWVEPRKRDQNWVSSDADFSVPV